MMFQYQMTVRKINTVGYARTNVIGSRTSFITASVHSSYVEICVFMGNLFQVLSLEQSCHPTLPFKQEKYNTKSKI